MISSGYWLLENGWCREIGRLSRVSTRQTCGQAGVAMATLRERVRPRRESAAGTCSGALLQWLRENWPLILITLLALFLRLYRLGSKSLWHDELGTLVYAGWGSNWADTVRQPLTVPIIPIPPLFFILTRLFTALGPRSVIVLRLPSVLAATMTVPVIYLLGKRAFGRQVGLLSAFLLAIAPLHVRYAQEARSYALLAFLSILSLYVFWRAIREGGWRWWSGFVLVTILNLYTHLFALLTVAVMAFFTLWVWVRPKRRAEVSFAWWHPLLVGAILLLAFSPMISFVFTGLTSERGVAAGTELVYGGLDWSLGSFVGALRLFSGGSYVGLAICLLLFALGAGFLARRQGDLLVLLVAWIVLPVLVILGTPFVHRVLVRYFLFALPVYLLVVAYGLNAAFNWLRSSLSRRPGLGRLRSAAVAVSGCVLLGLLVGGSIPKLLSYYPEYKQEWRGMAWLVQMIAAPEEKVYVLDERHRAGLVFYTPQGEEEPTTGAVDRFEVLSENPDEAFPQTGGDPVWLVVPFEAGFLPGSDVDTAAPFDRLLPPILLGPDRALQDSMLIAPFSQRALGLIRVEPAASDACIPGDREKIQAWLEVAQQGEVPFLDSDRSLGLLAYCCGDLDEADERFEAALKRDPSDALTYQLLGMVSEARELWNDAIAYYQRALDLDPSKIGLEVGIGDVHRDRGETEAALERYQRALNVFENPAWVYNQRGRLYERLGQVELALDDYQRAVALEPGNGWYHVSLGDLWLETGEALRAVAEYERALASTPEYGGYTWYLTRRGSAYRLAGEADQAIAAYEQGLALDPTLVAVRLWLSDLYFAAGRLEESAQVVQYAVQLEPDSPGAVFRLCRAFNRLGAGYENRVLAACRRAVELTPDQGWHRILLGDAYVANGAPESALLEYAQAVALEPDYWGRAWYHVRLGDAYHLSGKLDQAIQSYQAALELDPTNQGVRKKLERLQN